MMRAVRIAALIVAGLAATAVDSSARTALPPVDNLMPTNVYARKEGVT
jgi:hypothetical protein